MEREEMVEVIVNDLEAWLKRDEQSFWDHVRDIERFYLKHQSDVDLKDIYEGSV